VQPSVTMDVPSTHALLYQARAVQRALPEMLPTLNALLEGARTYLNVKKQRVHSLSKKPGKMSDRKFGILQPLMSGSSSTINISQ